MARPKNSPAAAPDTAKPAADVEAALVQAAERSALVLKQFGDGLPFDLPRYEHVIRNHLARSAEEMLAAGRALLVVREHVPHGEWMETLDRLGLHVNLAGRMTKAALKFSNSPTSVNLVEAAGNKSKLFELLVLDDEEIQELSEGGTVAGLTLDKIQTLSVSDLRKELREHQADKEANDKLMEEKNALIDKLTKDVAAAKRRIKSEEPAQYVIELRREFVAQTTALETALQVTIRDGIKKLLEIPADADTDPEASAQAKRAAATYASQALAQIRAHLDSLVLELGLPAVTLSEGSGPAWAQDDAQSVA
ncbi:DUF3102 domain-containing protein [Achromobacter xylosoxidans]|uniref:DUF3102 domain-containing protein n=1 Tax=Alcaligenes xylosoxydans xylosoxydans TaxID=85698 RepID=UPI001F0F71AF|nr:DUF3102 domain-containing protein [Achromobacter xylosoxidans]MCH4576609.1 DUF3102 domain-containing protein [Achromobacter xylosoxidans]